MHHSTDRLNPSRPPCPPLVNTLLSSNYQAASFPTSEDHSVGGILLPTLLIQRATHLQKMDGIIATRHRAGPFLRWEMTRMAVRGIRLVTSMRNSRSSLVVDSRIPLRRRHCMPHHRCLRLLGGILNQWTIPVSRVPDLLCIIDINSLWPISLLPGARQMPTVGSGYDLAPNRYAELEEEYTHPAAQHAPPSDSRRHSRGVSLKDEGAVQGAQPVRRVKQSTKRGSSSGVSSNLASFAQPGQGGQGQPRAGVTSPPAGNMGLPPGAVRTLSS